MAGRILDKIKEEVSAISRGATGVIGNHIKEKAKNTAEIFEEKIIRLEEKILKNFLGLLLISTGAVFISISLIFILEKVGLDNIFSFLIVGIILILIGIIIKIKAGATFRRFGRKG